MSKSLGKSFYNRFGRKCHIVNIFLDGDKEVITYKYWLKHRRWWIYESMPLRLFKIDFEFGGFKWAKNENQ